MGQQKAAVDQGTGMNRALEYSWRQFMEYENVANRSKWRWRFYTALLVLLGIVQIAGGYLDLRITGMPNIAPQQWAENVSIFDVAVAVASLCWGTIMGAMPGRNWACARYAANQAADLMRRFRMGLIDEDALIEAVNKVRVEARKRGLDAVLMPYTGVLPPGEIGNYYLSGDGVSQITWAELQEMLREKLAYHRTNERSFNAQLFVHKWSQRLIPFAVALASLLGEGSVALLSANVVLVLQIYVERAQWSERRAHHATHGDKAEGLLSQCAQVDDDQDAKRQALILEIQKFYEAEHKAWMMIALKLRRVYANGD